MKRNRLFTVLSSAALAGALATSLGSPAFADHDHGRGHGHGYDRHAGRDGHWDQDRGHGRDWHRGCPPGLIADRGHCIPPGHYRRADRDRDHHWRRGERLRRGEYRYINNYDAYHLRRLPRGERYVIVNNQVLRVNSNTLTVLGEVGLLNALLNH